jgi:dsDNA-binding SOS-regulon protein
MAANKIVVEIAAKDTSATALNQSKKNLKSVDQQTRRLEDATQRLIKEVTLEGMAIGKTADEIRLMKLEQDGATASQIAAARAAMTNRNELMKTGKQSGAFNGQMRLMRGGLGQVGHQVQDVAVQLQMGQNAMLVFGQQGSQVASLFGQRGALIGAIIAVGAAVATYMMPNMKKLSDVMNDVKSETGGLIDKFDTLSDSLKAVAIRQAEKKHEALSLAYAKQKEEIDGVVKSNNNLRGRNKSAKKDAGELTVMNQELADSLAVLNHMKAELTKKTDGVTDATESLLGSLTDELTTMKLSGRELAIYNAEKAGAVGANKDQIVSLYAQIEAETALQKATEESRKEQIKSAEATQKAYRKSFDDIGNGFLSAIQGGQDFSDAMRAMAKSVIDSLIKMLVQKYIVDAAFGAVTSFISNTQFGINSAAGYGSSLGGADPFNTANFAGGGYTGNGSRSGGLDGKGGFAAILHPRETVVDHHQGQSLGGDGITINQTINVTTGVQQTVRAEIATLMPQIANAAKGAVADARMRGGNYSKMLGA